MSAPSSHAETLSCLEIQSMKFASSIVNNGTHDRDMHARKWIGNSVRTLLIAGCDVTQFSADCTDHLFMLLFLTKCSELSAHSHQYFFVKRHYC
jgi:hypothetical protein